MLQQKKTRTTTKIQIQTTKIDHVKNNSNNRTLLVGPSFPGKPYLMLKLPSRIPLERDIYIITKSLPEQHSISKIIFKK